MEQARHITIYSTDGYVFYILGKSPVPCSFGQDEDTMTILNQKSRLHKTPLPVIDDDDAWDDSPKPPVLTSGKQPITA